MITEDRVADPLHNEKIVDLLETIENLKVEICSRDSKVDYLTKEVDKLRWNIHELSGTETQLQLTATKKQSLANTNLKLRDELNNQASQNQEALSKFTEGEFDKQTLVTRNEQLDSQLANQA